MKGGRKQDIAAQIFSIVEYLTALEVSCNIQFMSKSPGVVEIYICPRNRVQLYDNWIDVGFLDLAGLMFLKTRKDYDNVTECDLLKIVRETGKLSDDVHEMIAEKFAETFF